MFLIIIMYALSTLPLSKALITYTQPFFLIGLRMFCAGIVLCLYYYLFQKNKFHISRTHINYFLQAILFAILIPYFLRYWGLMNGSQPRADLLYMTGPLITYLLTGILGVEIMTRAKTFSLALGYCGLFLYFGNPIISYLRTPICFADLAIIISILSFAYGWIIIQRLIVDHKYSPVMVNGITMSGAGLIALTISAFTESMTITGNTTKFILILISIIIISNLFAHTLYASFVKQYNLTFIQICSFTTPLFAQSGYIIMGTQSLSLSYLIASSLIALSIGLFFIAEKTSFKLWHTYTID